MELGECNKDNSFLFSYVKVEYAILEVRIIEVMVLGVRLKYDNRVWLLRCRVMCSIKG